METPQTRYARSGDVQIAYQTIGEGPVDLIWVAGYVTHLDVYWEDPAYRRRATASSRPSTAPPARSDAR